MSPDNVVNPGDSIDPWSLNGEAMSSGHEGATTLTQEIDCVWVMWWAPQIISLLYAYILFYVIDSTKVVV